MKKKIYAIITEGNHEYDITVIKTNDTITYEMCYTESLRWSSEFRGELILCATDDGNGIKFTKKIKRSMDYCSFNELGLFMEFINRDGNISPEYNIYLQTKTKTK